MGFKVTVLLFKCVRISRVGELGGDSATLNSFLLIAFLSLHLAIWSLVLVGVSVSHCSSPPWRQMELYVSGLSRPPESQVEIWVGMQGADLCLLCLSG